MSPNLFLEALLPQIDVLGIASGSATLLSLMILALVSAGRHDFVAVESLSQSTRSARMRLRTPSRLVEELVH
jgi:hypothetical protein